MACYERTFPYPNYETMNRSNQLSTQWHPSIAAIPEKEWNQMFDNRQMKRHALFLSMERSDLQNATFWYLTIHRNNQIVAIVPCFTYGLQLDILAPAIVKVLSRQIRLIFPKFLCLRIFGVGSLASTCLQHIGIEKTLPLDEQKAVGKIISEQILLKSKELSHSLIFIKEIPHGELEELQNLLSKNFCFYDSLPNCYVPVYTEVAPYPCRLREKERYRYRQLKKRFNEQFYWELVQDFSSVLDIFEGLYLDTLHKSSNQFEVLNRKFFHALNERFPQESFMLIARNKVDNKCEAAGLLMEDKDALIPLYIGINYSNSSSTIKLLHSNAIFKAVEEAEKRGLFHAVLGQTCYYPKVLSGALVERLFLGFYAHNSLVQFLIKTIFGKLFAPTSVLPNAYAKAHAPRIKKVYADKNYRIFN